MKVDLVLLKNLIRKRTDEIEQSVTGTGYLAKTVIGVGTFLLDNEGNVDLLTAKQKITFEKFIEPLLASHSDSAGTDRAQPVGDKVRSVQKKLRSGE
jgi:hypothetical protein